MGESATTHGPALPASTRHISYSATYTLFFSARTTTSRCSLVSRSATASSSSATRRSLSSAGTTGPERPPRSPPTKAPSFSATGSCSFSGWTTGRFSVSAGRADQERRSDWRSHYGSGTTNRTSVTDRTLCPDGRIGRVTNPVLRAR